MYEIVIVNLKKKRIQLYMYIAYKPEETTNQQQ